jgi:hypothetical protein
MQTIDQKLQAAYAILNQVQNDDAAGIDDAFLAIEESSGFIAEVLSILRNEG